MKKLIIFVSVFAMIGCVDTRFDLSKVDDNNIVFGDEFAAPIGSITICYDELFDFPQNASKSTVQIEIPDNFGKTYNIKSGFDKGIVGQFTSSGTHQIVATVSNTLPNVELNMKIIFGEEVLFDQSIGSNNTTLNRDAKKELLEKLAETKNVKVEFGVISGNRVVIVDPKAEFKINLKLYRKGGIKPN